eukprot:792526-Rhodomonas_salina.2
MTRTSPPHCRNSRLGTESTTKRAKRACKASSASLRHPNRTSATNHWTLLSRKTSLWTHWDDEVAAVGGVEELAFAILRVDVLVGDKDNSNARPRNALLDLLQVILSGSEPSLDVQPAKHVSACRQRTGYQALRVVFVKERKKLLPAETPRRVVSVLLVAAAAVLGHCQADAEQDPGDATQHDGHTTESWTTRCIVADAARFQNVVPPRIHRFDTLAMVEISRRVDDVLYASDARDAWKHGISQCQISHCVARQRKAATFR